jgi:hypothetical protein
MVVKKHWLPVNFVKVGSKILVQLVDADLLDLSIGFFDKSLAALPKGKNPERIMGMDEWLTYSNVSSENNLSVKQDDSGALTGFIFHLARCGSTLLCQNLKRTKKYLVLGEPSVFSMLYTKKGKIDNASIHSLAVKFIKDWSLWASTSDKQLVVKLTSFAGPSYELISSHFPKSKNLLLTREPVKVLESLSRGLPRYYKNLDSLNLTTYCNQISSKSNNQTLINLSALYKKNIQSMNAIIAKKELNTLWVDYQNLSEQFESIIYFLGFIGSPPAKLTWSDKWSSKSKNKKLYQVIEQDVVDTFYNQNSEILTEINNVYEQFRFNRRGK